MKVKVNIAQYSSKMKLPAGSRDLIRRSCKQALICENFCDNAELNVSLVGEDEIKLLNREHRNIDKITDVLSFPLGDDGNYDINPENGYMLLGDVVICLKRANEQAQEYGHSLERELSFLTVHSMLHLLGYDHVNSKEEEKEMFARQDVIMSALNMER